MHCAGCADALEHKIGEIEGVKADQVNFITKILTLEIENENHEAIIDNVLKTIKKFDRMIKVEDPTLDASFIEKRNKQRTLIFIIISAVLLGAGFLFEKISFPLWVYLPIYIVAYALVGWPILRSSVTNAINGKLFDENFLMSIATIGAFAILKFGEAVMVMLLYQIGELLQGLAVTKSKNAISKLMDIKAQSANLLTEDGEIIVELNKVKVGSIIRVKPGEKIPLDGIITSGQSLIDTSALTGESKPYQVSEGSEVLSGSINGEGVLLIKVTKPESESTVSKIIEMVEEASMKKAKTENFISKFARVYTPIVCLIALGLIFVPCIFLGFGVFSEFLYRGLIFLVVSCPCALVISIPLGFFAGLGAAARKGILIRGGNFIEALNKVEAVVFDKTGTLTSGEFTIDKIYTYSEQSKDEVLEFVAYAENYSNHRIAKSIVSAYKEKNEINGAFIEDVCEEAGLGVSARVFMIPVLVGSKLLMEKNGILVNELKTQKTAIYLAVNGVHSGTITLKDSLKSDSNFAVKSLKNIGVKNVSMFSGDNEEAASEVSDKLNLDSFYYGMLPADKVEKLKEFQRDYKAIAFVGDGINDAPVLSTVDVGISMGGIGSDVAVSASDVVLMTDEPSKVTDAILISRKTHRIVMENVIFALIIKLGVLLISALGFGAMFLAVFADVGVSIIAVLNALRALKAPKFKEAKIKPAKVKLSASKLPN